MKTFFALCIITLITGCNSAERFLPKVMPPELRDCSFTKLYIDGSRHVIVRCPNSSVSTTSDGKHPTYSHTL